MASGSVKCTSPRDSFEALCRGTGVLEGLLRLTQFMPAHHSRAFSAHSLLRRALPFDRRPCTLQSHGSPPRAVTAQRRHQHPPNTRIGRSMQCAQLPPASRRASTHLAQACSATATAVRDAAKAARAKQKAHVETRSDLAGHPNTFDSRVHRPFGPQRPV